MARQQPDGPVADFCAELRRLEQDSGLDRAALARRLNYSRSQLYEILEGRITRPPEWNRLVEPLVRLCTGGDLQALAHWRRRYDVLLAVHRDVGRRIPAPHDAARAEPAPDPEPGAYSSPVGSAAVAEVSPRLERLAAVIYETVSREERHRRLLDPDPLPVFWRTVGPPHCDHWVNIRRDRVDAPLDLDGVLDGVHDVVSDARHRGRLVILGQPGAGKTAILTKFVLQAIARRPPGGPVPVPLRLSTWDPSRQSLRDWIARQVLDNYGVMLTPATDRRHPAAANGSEQPIRWGDLLPVLDGLDEMPASRRRAAIAAVNDSLSGATPFVLTSRVDEYREAIDGVVLSRAAVVEVCDLDVETACGYLRRATHPKRAHQWSDLLAPRSAGAPGPVAAALTTPLAISLARVAHADRDVDPTHLRHLRSRQAVELHLLDQLIPSLYPDPPEPARDGRRWRRDDAQRWMTFLARHLKADETHDIAWWRLAYAAPTAVRTIPFGTLLGLASALMFWLMGGAVFGLILGALLGTASALLYRHPTRPRPGRLTLRPTTEPVRRRVIRGLTITLLGGLVGVLGDWRGDGSVFKPGDPPWDGLVSGLLGGFVFGLIFGVIGEFSTTHHDVDAEHVTPDALLRQDRANSLISALITGLIGGVTAGVVVGASQRLHNGLLIGPVAGLVSALFVASTGAWAHFTVARAWLALTRRLPWRLLEFLDDAYQRGALRQAGAIYQFRHALLRDRLAETP